MDTFKVYTNDNPVKKIIFNNSFAMESKFIFSRNGRITISTSFTYKGCALILNLVR